MGNQNCLRPCLLACNSCILLAHGYFSWRITTPVSQWNSVKPLAGMCIPYSSKHSSTSSKELHGGLLNLTHKGFFSNTSDSLQTENWECELESEV